MVNGRDVVIAIIGGTMLGLALTRPRLRWVERLDESPRRAGEILVTILAFVTGGYAYGSLYLVLHRQLGGEIDKLLRGAGFFFAIYAGCLHFEPFSQGEGWRERGSAILLYMALASSSIMGGLICVEYTLNGSMGGWLIPTMAALGVGSAYGLYRFVRKSSSVASRGGSY